MRHTVINPITRRNRLLVAAGLLLLLSVLIGPAILFRMLTLRGIAGTALVITAGCFAANGICELAVLILREPGHPWYAKPWSLLVLSVGLICAAWLFSLLDNLVCWLFRMEHLVPQMALIFEFTAIELFWIVIFRSSGRARRNPSGASRHRIRQGPRFKPFESNDWSNTF